MCHLVVRVMTARIETPDGSGLFLHGSGVGGMSLVRELRLLGIKESPGRVKGQVIQ